MKKTFLLITVTLVIMLSACKKERTCECTSSGTSSNTNSQGVVESYNYEPTTTKTTYKKIKKSDLGIICGDRKYTSSSSSSTPTGGVNSGSSTTEIKCKIK
jgi:hypothetical protein